MNKITLAATVLAATGLSACSSPEDSEAFCSVFADASTYTLTCNAGCTVPADYSALHDGDLDTAVTIAPVAGQTTAQITLTVDNAGGADLPPGSVTGVFVTRPASGTKATAITSYHQGGSEPVDTTVNQDQRVVQSVEGGSSAQTFLGLRTDDPFDRVRFVTSYDWDSDPQAPAYFIYEICSDGGNT
jgi:hypothetical protein